MLRFKAQEQVALPISEVRMSCWSRGNSLILLQTRCCIVLAELNLSPKLLGSLMVLTVIADVVWKLVSRRGAVTAVCIPVCSID